MKRRVKSRTPIAKGAVRRRRRAAGRPYIEVYCQTYEVVSEGARDYEYPLWDRSTEKKIPVGTRGDVAKSAYKKIERQLDSYSNRVRPSGGGSFHEGVWYYHWSLKRTVRTVAGKHTERVYTRFTPVGFTESQERELFDLLTRW